MAERFGEFRQGLIRLGSFQGEEVHFRLRRLGRAADFIKRGLRRHLIVN